VGKIGIPDKILLKPGKLEADEFEVMKTHTTVGKNIVEEMMNAVKEKDSIYLIHCRDIAFCHHERYDGKGYPSGLKETDIPLAARIASVSDVYDALVCARVYKSALSHDDAMQILIGGQGAQFDPVVIDAALQSQERFQEIARIYM
jgi:putative two-component system response regulator